jgi:hypothetical protein
VQIPVPIVAGQTVFVGDMKPVLDEGCSGTLLVKQDILRWVHLAGRQASRRQAGAALEHTVCFACDQGPSCCHCWPQPHS